MVTHRVSRQSRDLSSMNAEMSGRVCSARQHAIRVCRQTETETANYFIYCLNVILCALFVSPPERTVWTLPRNDWWARDVTASIDINAWPNEMFTLNQLTVHFVSFVSSMSLFLSLVSAEEHASASDAMAKE